MKYVLKTLIIISGRIASNKVMFELYFKKKNFTTLKYTFNISQLWAFEWKKKKHFQVSYLLTWKKSLIPSNKHMGMAYYLLLPVWTKKELRLLTLQIMLGCVGSKPWLLLLCVGHQFSFLVKNNISSFSIIFNCFKYSYLKWLFLSGRFNISWYTVG